MVRQQQAAEAYLRLLYCVCSPPSHAVRLSFVLEMQGVLLLPPLHLRRLELPVLLLCVSLKVPLHVSQFAQRVVLKSLLLCSVGDLSELKRWVQLSRVGSCESALKG